MRCWVQTQSQRMMGLNKSCKQNVLIMSFVQQNKYVPQYVPHGPHWVIFINKISNLKGVNGGQTGRHSSLIINDLTQIKPFSFNRLRQFM